MTRIEIPDGHANARDRQLDIWQEVKHYLCEAIREKGRPIRASECPRFRPVQIGKCADRYPNTFKRFAGTSRNGKNVLAFIGFHPDIAKWEPNYCEHGHMLHAP